MELEERVAELERRIAALEAADREGGGNGGDGGDGGVPSGHGDEFWALQRLKEEVAKAGSPNGGVLYTGAVRLPTEERYEWQYGTFTDGLLDASWSHAAESFAALGHAVRLRLLREILGGRRTAAELAELDGIGTTGQIYHHLRQLTGAGWLHTTGRGRYEVPAARVVPLLVMLSAARP
ncbi:ArsR/SmtB family transcription factor [Streptomyces sp. NBC_00872]|uniref:ArsR/SmtB family transcription factor n=1 Tax=Streptomyces sp. NBC_00872 TaxID=2903686 RepID=UPI00386B2E15|nr:winged helix-turn-helix domain-containing protein [Streptomyces sp. NBC_00872]